MEILDRAEQLNNELDTLRPLDGEREARIMQKFRLDWNYHSNNLEGNSLTYGETKALILFGITAQGKPLKDHFEITGHNEAINWILEIVRGETVLTESFIRQLHTLLLKESSYKEALTPDGKPTRRKIEVGKYKTQPNHVITATGETFYFATSEETPAKMHDLIECFRKEKEKPNVNPIILAALFHYKFIRIHPFDDGNGRVARILMNFILMQFGYLPVIIKTEDKQNYYAVLRLADADERKPFIEYIAQNLVRSLEIMIKGAKGESIEEPDDLDKELALLEKKLKSVKANYTLKNSSSLTNVFNFSIKPLLSDFIRKCEKFSKFYNLHHIELEINNQYHRLWEDNCVIIIGKFIEEFGENLNKMIFQYVYEKLDQKIYKELNWKSGISFYFEPTKYKISSSVKGISFEKSYETQLTDEEIQKLIDSEIKSHIETLNHRINLVREKLPDSK